jgi:hypothetical protein
MKLKLFVLNILALTIIGCNNNSINTHKEITQSEKKILISSIQLKDSIYYFNEQFAKNKGISDVLIKKIRDEINTVNKDIEDAKKLPNSIIELTDPKDLEVFD